MTEDTSERKRVPAEERRRRIIEAVMPVFADKGFHGATTRELAEAAGVSEGLLYKHFPSKESLFQAIFDEHLEAKLNRPEIGEALATPPSTGRLVRSLAILIGEIARLEDDCFGQLVLRSLLQDGEFARTVLAAFRRDWFEFFSESLHAAHEAGDLVVAHADAEVGIWLTHHLAAALKFFALPGGPVADYGVSRPVLIDRTLRFALRGLGLREEALIAQLGPPIRPTEDPETAAAASANGHPSRRKP